jgi:hypothetical protein
MIKGTNETKIVPAKIAPKSVEMFSGKMRDRDSSDRVIRIRSNEQRPEKRLPLEDEQDEPRRDQSSGIAIASQGDQETQYDDGKDRPSSRQVQSATRTSCARVTLSGQMDAASHRHCRNRLASWPFEASLFMLAPELKKLSGANLY